MKYMLKSWKTTVLGLIAIGFSIALFISTNERQDTAFCLLLIGLIGLSSKDNNVTGVK